MSEERSDALVIGSNLAALTVAHFLSSFGYSVRVIDRAAQVGGTDRSFQNRCGRTFDFGFHSLAYMRSELVTKLFLAAIDGAVHHHEHRRGMVLRGHQVPYNAPPKEWPSELAELLPPAEVRDTIGGAPPTRERIAGCYGPRFADFIYDEVLASYPAELRQLEFGIEAWKLLVNIYPWFFPRVERARVDHGSSRAYQDSVREGREESLLYPKRGGFGAFASAFRRKLEAAGVEFVLGADDFETEIRSDPLAVETVRAGGRRFHSDRVYWCASPTSLCEAIGQPLPPLDPDWFVLGSFQFAEPIDCAFTELIVGDPDHAISRISFPGRLAGERDDLVQLEFAYPKAVDPYGKDAAAWCERWTESLRALGIAPVSNALVDFDFKRVPLLYNCYGVEGEPTPELDLRAIPSDSNLKPVLPTLRKVNINTRVPQYLAFLTEDLRGAPRVPSR